MKHPLAVASMLLTMQATHEICSMIAIEEIDGWSPRLAANQLHRLRVTLIGAMLYLQDAGFRDGPDLRALLLLDALADWQRLMRNAEQSRPAVAAVEASFKQLLQDR